VGQIGNQLYLYFVFVLPTLNKDYCYYYYIESDFRLSRANHCHKLKLRSAKLYCFKYSFFIRTVEQWNNLPKEIGRNRYFVIINFVEKKELNNSRGMQMLLCNTEVVVNLITFCYDILLIINFYNE
jgi:hypothetical protein